MHPTFQKFLEPIEATETPAPERLQIAVREIQATERVNEFLSKRGDTAGVKVGEEYITAVRAAMKKHGVTL